MSENQNFIIEPQRKVPVFKKVDVVIAGGGPAGMAAAVFAARDGADVLLVERNSYLGGMATASFQVYYGGPTDILTGFSREFAQRMDKLGAAKLIERGRYQPAATGISPLTYHVSIDPETWKYVASDMVEESGAKMLTNTVVVDAISDRNTVKGIIIENKSGRQAIMADVVIDCSGDADIAARAGAPIDTLVPNTGILMPMVMLCRIGGIDYQKIAEYARANRGDFTAGLGVPPGEFDGINTASIQGMGGWRSLIKQAKETGELPADFGRSISLVGVNPAAISHGIGYIYGLNVLKHNSLDAQSVCQAELEGRKLVRTFARFLKTVPGFEKSFLIDVAHSIGNRDSRRIIGDYILTRKDIRDGRTFPDDIGLITLTWPDVPVSEDGGWLMHPADGSEQSEAYKRSVGQVPYFQVVFGLPYRCMLPRGLEGLLVAGHTVSMTYMAHEPGPCRGMVTAMHWGQAAGAAAAIASKQKIMPRRVDVQALRKKLEAQGVNLSKGAVDLTEVKKMIELRGAKIGHTA